MKQNAKIINIIAGIWFLWQALNRVLSLLNMVTAGTLLENPPIATVQNLFGIGVLIALGIQALCQKKRGIALNVMGYVFMGLLVFNFIRSLPYMLGNVQTLISSFIPAALTVAAFLLTGMIHGKNPFSVKDNKSEAAMIKAQAQKQTNIYEEQLKAGLLTQEEYDQIMKSRK